MVIIDKVIREAAISATLSFFTSIRLVRSFFSQARERQRIEEQERLERERAEVEQKQREEEEAREREAREAAEREAALARRKQEKALSLGAEPEKGPDVTQVSLSSQQFFLSFQNTDTAMTRFSFSG